MVKDTAFITPVIQEILAINPAVKVLATPWTPPAWMLASGSFEHGGCTFNNTYKAPYAQYFVKFIQAYQSMGIPIWAVTAQNEAVGGWFLSLSQSKETNFIGAHLGPALASAGLGNVKIFAMDDQWSNASYGQAVYTANSAHPYTAGIAYHGYRGSPVVMSSAYGEQHLTEWRSKVTESLAITMAGMAGGYVAGGVSNWARSVILWNLALEQWNHWQPGFKQARQARRGDREQQDGHGLAEPGVLRACAPGHVRPAGGAALSVTLVRSRVRGPHDVPVGHHHDRPGQPGRVGGPLCLQRGGEQQDVPDHRRQERYRAHRQHDPGCAVHVRLVGLTPG